ncbi:hypothetical protein [Parabacteroides sp.]
MNMEEKKQEDKTSGRIPGMSFNAPVTFNAPMFEIHDNTNVYINAGGSGEANAGRGNVKSEREKGEDAADSPLSTVQACELFRKLAEAGILDEHNKPLALSNAEKGVLAGMLATRLGIKNLWQVFGDLWEMKPETLRGANAKAQSQKKTLRFLDKLKSVLS